MHIVNVRGPVVLTNLMLPHMLSAGKGRIINISSEAAITSLPMMTAYNSTKASMLSFTSCLQEELKFGPIRAFAVHPGTIEGTSLTDIGSTNTGQPDARLLSSLGGDDEVTKLMWLDKTKLSAQTIVYIATGKADVLAGLYISSNDNIAELVAKVDEINEERLYKTTVDHLSPK